MVSAFAADLRALGMANFLYSDGELLFVHGHRRNQPDGKIAPPGLHRLQRRCGGVSGNVHSGGVELDTPQQTVTLIASVPLTGEAWQPLDEGELLMISGR